MARIHMGGNGRIMMDGQEVDPSTIGLTDDEKQQLQMFGELHRPTGADKNGQQSQGYQNPAMTPGLGPFADREAAFMRTIAPERRTPNTLSGKAGIGDTEALQTLLSRARDDSTRQANMSPAGGGFIVGPGTDPMQASQLWMNMHSKQAANQNQEYDRAEKAIMSSLGLGAEAFKQDTERAKAGVAEYGAKVVEPAKAATDIEKAKIEAASREKTAMIGRNTAIEAPIIMDLVKKLNDPNATEAEVNAALGAMRQIRGYLGNKGGTDVMPIDQNAIDKSKKARDTAQQSRDLQQEALAMTKDAQGNLQGGSFDPARAAQILVKRAATDEQLKEMAKKMRQQGYGRPDDLISNMGRAYTALSRSAGKHEGAGDFAIDTTGAGLFSNPLVLTNPTLGQLKLSEPQGPMGRLFSGTQNLFPQGTTPKAREEAGTQAAALARLMRFYIEAGMTPEQASQVRGAR